MYYVEYLNKLSSFVNKLQDEESKLLFDARFSYFINRDDEQLEENLGKVVVKYKDTFYCWGLEQYYNRHPENRKRSFVVFGAGFMGRSTIRTLNYLGLVIDGVVDNSSKLQGTEVAGIEIENPNVISQKYAESIIIVAVTKRYQLEMYYQLLNMGISDELICMHQEGGLYCDFGKQYFDLNVLEPKSDDEVFVDAGCYDGKSSINASQWAKGRLKKVYAFEPDANSIKQCESAISSIGCEYELFNIATWSKRDTLCFDVHNNAGYGSKVSNIGEALVNADSIDNMLNGKPVTYIKLDVEGSEIETLKGAINTIKKYRPQMAISIYHKPEDIVEIPVFLEQLHLNYKYYIRQYQTRKCETTLYCV